MSVTVHMPTGGMSSFPLSPNMTEEQLREQVLPEARKATGLSCMRVEDLRLIFNGLALNKTSPLLPYSVFHLTMRVHGG